MKDINYLKSISNCGLWSLRFHVKFTTILWQQIDKYFPFSYCIHTNWHSFYHFQGFFCICVSVYLLCYLFSARINIIDTFSLKVHGERSNRKKKCLKKAGNIERNDCNQMKNIRISIPSVWRLIAQTLNWAGAIELAIDYTFHTNKITTQLKQLRKTTVYVYYIFMRFMFFYLSYLSSILSIPAIRKSIFENHYQLALVYVQHVQRVNSRWFGGCVFFSLGVKWQATRPKINKNYKKKQQNIISDWCTYDCSYSTARKWRRSG